MLGNGVAVLAGVILRQLKNPAPFSSSVHATRFRTTITYYHPLLSTQNHCRHERSRHAYSEKLWCSFTIEFGVRIEFSPEVIVTDQLSLFSSYDLAQSESILNCVLVAQSFELPMSSGLLWSRNVFISHREHPKWPRYDNVCIYIRGVRIKDFTLSLLTKHMDQECQSSNSPNRSTSIRE